MPGRVSFFIVRILVWNRKGLALRSVGSNNMHPLVPSYLRQELHVVCQRVRRVHQFPVTGIVENGVFLAFGLLLGALCIWEVLALLVCRLLCAGPRSHRCASC